MMGKATRQALGDALLAMGEARPEVFVVDCDVSKSCMTAPFSQRFPQRHINVGIAEQNAMGIAAGLATTGKIPFVVTYAVFGSMRALEQIRQELCYTGLPVKIACSHGGVTPANDGASHQCVEDMGILRTLPNMTVIMPADYASALVLMELAADYPGPVYLRFTRDPVETLYPAPPALTIGKAHLLRDGQDVALIANGDTVAIAMAAAQTLARQGVEAMVYDMHTVKPLDRQAVFRALDQTGRIITVEDHNIMGGLGSAVCEVVAEAGYGMVKRMGIQDRFGESAPYGALLAQNGITAEQICAEARRLMQDRQGGRVE